MMMDKVDKDAVIKRLIDIIEMAHGAGSGDIVNRARVCLEIIGTETMSGRQCYAVAEELALHFLPGNNPRCWARRALERGGLTELMTEAMKEITQSKKQYDPREERTGK